MTPQPELRKSLTTFDGAIVDIAFVATGLPFSIIWLRRSRRVTN